MIIIKFERYFLKSKIFSMSKADIADDYVPLTDREREKPDGLTRQQVNQVLMTVEDIHPL